MTNAFPLIPQSASNLAASYDHLFYALLALTAVITLGITFTLLLFIIKYRRRHPDQIGQNTGDHISLEITWTLIPLIICLGIFAWSAKLFVRMSQPPDNALTIQVVGKQWMWKLQHPSGRKEINELHVPLGQPIRLLMTSQDVIHSFFVPDFRIKQDVLPGRYSQQWFIPTRLGQYHLFCSQYCGTSHSQMQGWVIVMSPGDYQQWAANAALDERPEVAGEKLFSQYGCMACHGQQGPTLAGIYNREQIMQDGTHVLANDDYLRESILYPRAKIVAGFPPIMPSYDGQLSEEQLFQLLAYIKSLQAPAGPPTLPPNSVRQSGGNTP